MVSVCKRDRDALRFLWVKDIKENMPEIQVLRFTRVTFGVASSPFLLNATIRNHMEQFKDTRPELVNKLLRSLYVDDVVSGASSAEEALQWFTEFKEVLAKGGFNLRKFVSNSIRVEGSSSGECHKVLGITWNVGTDELVIDMRDIVLEANVNNPTKRHAVSVASKIYDPMGLVSPVTVRFKMFLQDLHSSKLGWDDEITGNLLHKWVELVSSVKLSEPFSIPRCYFSTTVREYKLCGFSDASTKAYAAVVYLQGNMETERRSVFVASKTRIAPIKQQTIPRLELLGALLLVRLVAKISAALQSEISLLEPECYTDSQVALYWIKGSNRDWKPFVDNRIKEIRSLTSPDSWRHCPGKDNPADLPSRGLSPGELASSSLWHTGPTWLNENHTVYEEPPGEMPASCVEEMRVSERRECGSLVRENELDCIELERFSSFDRLIRVTAFVLKAIAIFKCGRKSACEKDFVEYCDEAEVLWVREAQASLIHERNFKKWKTQLQLFKDRVGLWRCKGRLGNADLPYGTKHPILLPTKHRLTELIIKRAHERVFHNGVKDTLSEIRSAYWIIKGRSVVRGLIHRCVLCKRIEGHAYGAPGPPPLPEFRVKEDPPFSYTGLDLAGPFFVKNGVVSVEGKVWICLYTCCVTRAVCLDVLPNMSIDFFFRCFRRFVARHGLPRHVISDNAKTFKKAAKVFKGIMKRPGIDNHLGNARIKWTFNVERAPWWGGFFERLIRSVKRCLKKVIGRARLTAEELLTLVLEVEMIINSRPLSYVTQEDFDEPITPSHLLIGRRMLSIPDNLCYSEEVDEDFEITQPILSKRMIHLSRTIDRFWTRWRTEYLLQLRDAHRGSAKASTGEKIKIDDIVVVHSDDKKRGFWDLGRIEDIIKGRDGKIRSALVRVYTGNQEVETIS